DASPVVPDRAGAVSAVFARDQGVALRFLPPRLAPAGSDVFDYTTPRGDTLFSVQAAPPTQGDAKLTRLTRAAGLAGAGVAAALAVDTARGVCLGHRRRRRGPVAVGSGGRVARLVHIRLASGTRRCARAGPATLGGGGNRHRRRHRGRPNHLGRGGGGPPGA